MQRRRHNAKVTSKGRVTIPREVRRLLRLQPGDSVVFEINGDVVHLRAASHLDLRTACWHLARR